ncbi:MAG: hypothetical protein K6T83_01235 [Alicyclobacillus sp.]|nr:hypothetical protein [Alicyclobacillus sp.]
MGLEKELPTKLDYESERSVPSGLHNVLDFQRVTVRYWNSDRLTKRQRRLFAKLCQWNNVLVARKHGYTWCHECKDKGIRYFRRGMWTCECAATGYQRARKVTVNRAHRAKANSR